jgi:hypothetical protein
MESCVNNWLNNLSIDPVSPEINLSHFLSPWSHFLSPCRIRRIVAALTAGTIFSVIACHARSWLDQWVMCSPFATGSRQASWTICARCRGGNPQWPACALRPLYHTGHTHLLLLAHGALSCDEMRNHMEFL